MWKPQGIYADFMLYQPTVFFGETALSGLSTFSGARIAILCSDSLDEDIKERLRFILKKKSVFFVGRSWSGEPDIDGLKGSISALEEVKPDVIIAIGGGSIIDGVKLCRLFYEFPYFKIGETRLAQLPFKTKFIAIPTTVGSGAEASSAAVFLNRAKERKEMIISHDLQPSVIILDSDFVSNAPEKIIVSSALDAIGHIVEGYVSNRNNKLTDIYAETALSILYKEFLKREIRERDYQRIQYAGYLGGVVQNHCVVGAAHALAHQLTKYEFSHGEAVALLLPGVIKMNYEDSLAKDKYNKLCDNAKIDSISHLIDFIEMELRRTGIADKNKELKVILARLLSDEQFISNAVNDMGGKGNPVPINKDYIGRLVGEFL